MCHSTTLSNLAALIATWTSQRTPWAGADALAILIATGIGSAPRTVSAWATIIATMSSFQTYVQSMSRQMRWDLLAASPLSSAEVTEPAICGATVKELITAFDLNSIYT